MNTTTCEKCGKEIHAGEFPFCPHERGNNNVIGDEVDITITNGLCNLDGTPKRYTSREEMNREAKKRGFTSYVVATDDDQHVMRWATGLPPGVDGRPMSMLSEEEQRKRREEWARA